MRNIPILIKEYKAEGKVALEYRVDLRMGRNLIAQRFSQIIRLTYRLMGEKKEREGWRKPSSVQGKSVRVAHKGLGKNKLEKGQTKGQIKVQEFIRDKLKELNIKLKMCKLSKALVQKIV